MFPKLLGTLRIPSPGEQGRLLNHLQTLPLLLPGLRPVGCHWVPSHHCYQVALDSDCESLAVLWEHSFRDTDCKLHLVAVPLGNLHPLLQPSPGSRLWRSRSQPVISQHLAVPTAPPGPQRGARCPLPLCLSVHKTWTWSWRRPGPASRGSKGGGFAGEPLRFLLHCSHCVSVKGASLSSLRLMASSRTSSIDKIN